jgi:hypothetical protein
MYFVILFYSILFQACKDMLSWEPFMDLLDEADKCETYSLFIIQGIRPLRRKEMLLETVPAMASELRDMFMVYCDGMDIGLRKLAEDPERATPLVDGGNDVHPPAAFKYSQLHINVIAHVNCARSSGRSFTHPYRISLRDDAPSIDWNQKNIDWEQFRHDHRLKGFDCAPPVSTAQALCAACFIFPPRTLSQRRRALAKYG